MPARQRPELVGLIGAARALAIADPQHRADALAALERAAIVWATFDHRGRR